MFNLKHCCSMYYLLLLMFNILCSFIYNVFLSFQYINVKAKKIVQVIVVARVVVIIPI